jgi:hypothetical protein
MPITLQCTCGTQFRVLEDLAGRHVHCPGCRQVVAVPGAVTAAPPPQVIPRQEAIILDEPAPRRPRRRIRRRSNLGLWLGLGAGGLMLGFCCLGAGAFGLVWFLNRPERALLGKWVLDTGAPVFGFSGYIEFRSNGTMTDTSPITPIVDGRWRIIAGPGGDVVRIEITTVNGRLISTLDIRIKDSDHIAVRNLAGNFEIPLRRAAK